MNAAGEVCVICGCPCGRYVWRWEPIRWANALLLHCAAQGRGARQGCNGEGYRKARARGSLAPSSSSTALPHGRTKTHWSPACCPCSHSSPAAALTPAFVVRTVLQKAKDIFNVFQESTSAFVEGYREAVELHDKPQPAAAAGGLRAGEARPDTSTAAPAPAESPEATNDGGSWTKQGSSEVLAASSSMSDASGLGRAAENKENLENRTRAAPR
jgi:hypothetical protein